MPLDHAVILAKILLATTFKPLAFLKTGELCNKEKCSHVLGYLTIKTK